LHEDSAWERLAFADLNIGIRGTYVIREAAAERKSRATMESMPEMAAPRRPQQARKAPKKVRTSKNRAIRKKTQPKRHM
jgi:hypothetical protein